MSSPIDVLDKERPFIGDALTVFCPRPNIGQTTSLTIRRRPTAAETCPTKSRQAQRPRRASRPIRLAYDQKSNYKACVMKLRAREGKL